MVQVEVVISAQVLSPCNYPVPPSVLWAAEERPSLERALETSTPPLSRGLRCAYNHVVKRNVSTDQWFHSKRAGEVFSRYLTLLSGMTLLQSGLGVLISLLVCLIRGTFPLLDGFFIFLYKCNFPCMKLFFYFFYSIFTLNKINKLNIK